jgi:hypothetical protein
MHPHHTYDPTKQDLCLLEQCDLQGTLILDHQFGDYSLVGISVQAKHGE